jgi:hypothetical protein
VNVLAVIRPDEWNFPLLMHVLGAFLLVGALVLSASVLLLAARDGTVAQARLGFRSLLWGVLPAWVVMRGGAQWIADKEGLEDADLAWIDIGFITGDSGFLFLLIATVLAGLALRRASRDGGSSGMTTAAGVLSVVMLIAYLVTIWAMSAKPA